MESDLISKRLFIGFKLIVMAALPEGHGLIVVKDVENLICP